LAGGIKIKFIFSVSLLLGFMKEIIYLLVPLVEFTLNHLEEIESLFCNAIYWRKKGVI